MKTGVVSSIVDAVVAKLVLPWPLVEARVAIDIIGDDPCSTSLSTVGSKVITSCSVDGDDGREEVGRGFMLTVVWSGVVQVVICSVVEGRVGGGLRVGADVVYSELKGPNTITVGADSNCGLVVK